MASEDSAPSKSKQSSGGSASECVSVTHERPPASRSDEPPRKKHALALSATDTATTVAGSAVLQCHICQIIISSHPVRATDPSCPYVACSLECLGSLNNRWVEERCRAKSDSASHSVPPTVHPAPVERPQATCTFLRTALVVQQPWADLLLAGTKTIEIRNQPCDKHAGTRIAIAVSGTKRLHGEVDFVKCEKISFATFQTPEYKRAHRIEDMETTDVVRKYKALYAWHMARPFRYAQPVSFPFPQGAIKWVTLPVCTFPLRAPPPSAQLAAPAAEAREANDPRHAASSRPPSSSVPFPNPVVALAAGSASCTRVAAPSFATARAALRRAFPKRRAEVTNDYLLSLDARAACVLLGYTDDLPTMDARCACGLENIGQTCYANALLACLSQVLALRTWTSQHLALRHGDGDHPASCVLCAFARDL